MRTINGSSAAIDNIFIDLSRNFTINPLINGLSDRDAWLLKLKKKSLFPYENPHLAMLETQTALLYMNSNVNWVWKVGGIFLQELTQM
jgi:hypothetical protein